MNLTFLDHALWWDVIFVFTLLFCIRSAAEKGALRALSGIVGTVFGAILANIFRDGLTPFLEPALRPFLQSLAEKADVSRFANISPETPLGQLIAQGALADKMSALYQTFLTTLVDTLTESLAPILAFLILFFITRFGIQMLCGLLDLDFPILSGLNRMAGGLLGALAGLLVILVLCWAVMRFAPAENVGLLSQPCLLDSFFGGLLGPLFLPITL